MNKRNNINKNKNKTNINGLTVLKNKYKHLIINYNHIFTT